MLSAEAKSKNHNQSRYAVYKTAAIDFVDGEMFNPNYLAHLLTDLRWNEVPRAFSVAILNASRRGPVRSNLTESFDGLLQQVAFTSFGSVERRVLQPWFLQGIDFFFTAMFDGLLLLNMDNTKLRSGHNMPAFRRALDAMFEMLEGAKKYMSLDSAVDSPGVHTLLAACSSTSGSFLKNGMAMYNESCDDDPACKRDLTLAHVLFMDKVASLVLADGNREIETWNRPFGQFLGSRPWTLFAKRCMRYATPTFVSNHPYARQSHMFVSNIFTLEDEFRKAFQLLRNEKHSIEVFLEQEKMMESMAEFEPLQPVDTNCIRTSLAPAAFKKCDAKVLFNTLTPPTAKSNLPFETGTLTDARIRNGSKRLKTSTSIWVDLPQDILSLILCNHIDNALVNLDNQETTASLLGMRLVSKGVKALTESYVGLQTECLIKDAEQFMKGQNPSLIEIAPRALSIGLGVLDLMLLSKHRGPVEKIDGWTLPKTPSSVPNLRWFLEVRHEARKRHGAHVRTTKPEPRPVVVFDSKIERLKVKEPQIWSSQKLNTPNMPVEVDPYHLIACAGEVQPTRFMHEIAGV
jgi:hypothetical protein